MSPGPGPEPRSLGSTDLKRLHRSWRRRPTSPVALLLEDVQTPYNVGSILRTAAAFRVDHLWLVGRTAEPHGAKTQKTAMGTQRHLTWTTVEEIGEAVAGVAAAGYRLVGIELADPARALYETDLTGAVCLAVGHEDRGLSRSCLASCDAIGYVPLLGGVGSLNVATAASIALYEARRQTWTAAG